MFENYLFFLFLNQNICCGYLKEPSQSDGSFEHPTHMFKLMDKKMVTYFMLKRFASLFTRDVTIHRTIDTSQ